MEEEKMIIKCDNDLYKYDNRDIYDYIYDLQQSNQQLKAVISKIEERLKDDINHYLNNGEDDELITLNCKTIKEKYLKPYLEIIKEQVTEVTRGEGK